MKSFLYFFIIGCFAIHGSAVCQSVGIGTASPLFKLDVRNGSINTDSVYRIGTTTILTAPGTKNLFVGFAAGASNSGTENTFCGYGAGASNTTGNQNAFFGREAGRTNTTASNNSYFGNGAGFTNQTGTDNAFFGRFAGYSNQASNNSYFGSGAGYSSVSGFSNCAFGASSLLQNLSDNNCAFGESSLLTNYTGFGNTAMGSNTLTSNTIGISNTAFGFVALTDNTTGSFNTALGAAANVGSGDLSNATAIGAKASVNASNSIVLGSIDGVNGATSSVNVGIGTQTPDAPFHVKSNSSSGLPGILVEENEDDYARISFQSISFSARFWDIAALNKSTNSNAEFNFFFNNFGNVLVLKGNGNATLSGTLTQLSDSRLKTSITPLKNSLSKVLQLNGYTYRWKDNARDTSVQIGVMAQEVQKLFPQLVSEDKDGLLSVNYNGLIPVLINALKEQQQQIDELLNRIKKLEKN